MQTTDHFFTDCDRNGDFMENIGVTLIKIAGVFFVCVGGLFTGENFGNDGLCFIDWIENDSFLDKGSLNFNVPDALSEDCCVVAIRFSAEKIEGSILDRKSVV